MNRDLIDQASQLLSIQLVLMRHCQVVADNAILPPADPELAVQARYRAGSAGRMEIAHLDEEDQPRMSMAIFHFSTGVRLVDVPANTETDASPDEETVRLEISAEFVVHYRLKPGSDIDSIKDALDEFARCNVGFHVWPYWREFIQSTCARMGIPNIPIPMYRLQSDATRTDKS